MDHPAASDSSASALGLILTPARTVQRHLAVASDDREAVIALYGALLTGKVYAKDFEIVLGVSGPFVEFISQPTASGPALVLFTSRDRFPPETKRIEMLPFAYLLELLPRGVALVLDPGHEAFVISAEDAAMLKMIAG
jgi:hypothetical protein